MTLTHRAPSSPTVVAGDPVVPGHCAEITLLVRSSMIMNSAFNEPVNKSSLTFLLPPQTAEGGYIQPIAEGRSTLLLPFGQVAHPTGVGGSPLAPRFLIIESEGVESVAVDPGKELPKAGSVPRRRWT